MSSGYSVSLFSDWRESRFNQAWIKTVAASRDAASSAPKDISAPDEVLVLLFWAPNNPLKRGEIRQFATGQTPQNVALAISRLLKSKEIRLTGDGEVARTPTGQSGSLRRLCHV